VSLVAIEVDLGTVAEVVAVTDVDLVLDPEEADPVETDDLGNGTNDVVNLLAAVEIVNLATENLVRNRGTNLEIGPDPDRKVEMSNGNGPVLLQELPEDLQQLPDPPDLDPVKILTSTS